MGLGSSRAGTSAGAAIRSYVRALEEWWFDTTRHVRTRGDSRFPDATKVVGEIRDSEIYSPVRVANAHDALHELPCKDLSEYTFIDVGSGKGRMLFVAAEYAFRKVQGVEFSVDLHEQARANISLYRHGKQCCNAIESVQANAAEYEFPDEKLVIYMFNPFGPEVMSRMLCNLERSLKRFSRHVVVVMMWPEHADLLAAMPEMQTYKESRRYNIYQTVEEQP